MSGRAESGRVGVVVVLALVALALILSWPVLHFGLSGWDTDRYYVQNPLLELPLSACLAEAWTASFVQSYHPLHVSLVCVQGTLSDDPVVWHAFSVVLFGGMAAALVVAFRALGLAWVVAGLAAGLVLAHPAMVETYASIPSQKDQMALIFVAVFLALVPKARSRGRVVALAACLVGAAWSKSGYALPLGFAPLLHDAIFGLGAAPEVRPSRRRWAIDAGLAGLGLALTALAFVVVLKTELPKEDAAWMDPALILSTVTYYAGTILLFGSPPPVPCNDFSAAAIAAGGAAVVAYGAAVWAALRFDRRLAAFGLLLAGLGIAPYLNAIPTPTLLSGRWLLMLLLGTALAVADVARARAGIGVLAALVFLGVGMSVRAQQPWSSREALWTDNVARNDCSAEPYSNLATAYSLQARWADAEEMLVRGIRIQPDRSKLYRDWALLVMLTGGCEPAMAPLEAKRRYDDIQTEAFTAAQARAMGRLDVARILMLRRALAGGDPLDDRALFSGRVCSGKRLGYFREVLEAGRR